MKKIFIALVGLLLVSAVFSTGCASQAGGGQVAVPQLPGLPAPGAIFSQQNVGLWVNGEGKIMAAPDIAMLALGVQTQQSNVADAQRQAADAMSKMVSVIKGKGVADKDIQTQGYNISQVTRWDSKGNIQVIVGYSVTNTMVIKIRKLEDTGSIIDAAANAGGDSIRVNSISFGIDDPKNYQKQARELAIKDAMEKAKQIASVSGVRLGRIVYINESIPYTPSPVVNFSKMDSAGAAQSPVTPVSGGELTVTVDIQMVYDTN
jgi:uncharacterized protein